MGDMQFEQDNAGEFGAPPAASNSGMTALLIKWGLVSSEQEAQYVLVGIAVIALILTFFFLRAAFA